MSDRRREILGDGLSLDGTELHNESDVLRAMDEYMKESCLALLQYMADYNIRLSLASTSQEPLFIWAGDLLTKEQVFENFL